MHSTALYYMYSKISFYIIKLSLKIAIFSLEKDSVSPFQFQATVSSYSLLIGKWALVFPGKIPLEFWSFFF